MIFWLDHLIFGNGWGLRSPHCDDRFYWLSGRLYKWSMGLGAQLTSFQWTHPKAHERRTLSGLTFAPFRSERCLGRVRVSWYWVNLSKDLNQALSQLRQIEKDLGDIFPASVGRNAEGLGPKDEHAVPKADAQ